VITNEHLEAGAENAGPDGTLQSEQARGGALRTNGALDLRVGEIQAPVFIETDEIFRGIYTRAVTGFTSEVLAICSAISGEGKTTIGVGLAVTIAQDFPDRRVLVVETDLQRPVLADDFGIDSSPGLADCLVNGVPLLAACRPTYIENLHVLPAGALPRIPGRPLRSSQMAALVEVMRENYHMVILDLPPVLSNSDSILLTDLVDAVICVVRAGVTPSNLVTRMLEQIEEAKLRGVVLNGTRSAAPGWLRRVLGL
jgi:capsular exopolysaccharide synthesis family protein